MSRFHAELATKTVTQPRDVTVSRWTAQRQSSGQSFYCSSILTIAEYNDTASERLVLRQRLMSLHNDILFIFTVLIRYPTEARNTDRAIEIWSDIFIYLLFVLRRDCVFSSFVNVFITSDEQTLLSLNRATCFPKTMFRTVIGELAMEQTE